MAVVHPSKGLKCDGFGSFSFFPSGFLFLRRKKNWRQPGTGHVWYI